MAKAIEEWKKISHARGSTVSLQDFRWENLQEKIAMITNSFSYSTTTK